MLLKGFPKLQHVQDFATGFSYAFFCHMFIDAPEKLPKFGAFSILGTALGQAEKTGAKELNVFEPEESSNEELEVAEKEELTQDVSGEPKEGVPK